MSKTITKIKPISKKVFLSNVAADILTAAYEVELWQFGLEDFEESGYIVVSDRGNSITLNVGNKGAGLKSVEKLIEVLTDFVRDYKGMQIKVTEVNKKLKNEQGKK